MGENYETNAGYCAAANIAWKNWVEAWGWILDQQGELVG